MRTENRRGSRIWKSLFDGRFECWTILLTPSRSINGSPWKKPSKKRPICGKICSRRYSENKMHHLAKVSLVLTLASLTASLLSAPKKDYFTEDELDLIRDAQELSARVPAYFKLAERRLIFLGLMEKSAQQIEKERKDKEKREKEQKKSTDSRANANKAP